MSSQKYLFKIYSLTFDPYIIFDFLGNAGPNIRIFPRLPASYYMIISAASWEMEVRVWALDYFSMTCLMSADIV